MEIRLPEEFRNKMTQMLGNESDAFFLSYSHLRYQALRINPLKITPEDFLSLSSFHLTPVPWAAEGFYYSPEDRPGKSPFHEAGLFYIQEPSAMVVGALSGVQPEERVLDLCAAPGGKSTHLAGRMKGNGLLVSNEIHPQRARILSRNIERFGIQNAIVTNESPEHLAEHFPSFFDRIIVDAPCSGEGMFRKEEAALTDWSPETVLRCAKRQKDILNQADLMLKAGGTLVYSTCTFSMEENESNIQWFLSQHPEYVQKDMPRFLGDRMEKWGLSAGFDQKSIRLWPHKLHGEGHFLTVLQKTGIPDLLSAQDKKQSFLYESSSSPHQGKERKKPKPQRHVQAASKRKNPEHFSLKEAVSIWEDFASGNLSSRFHLPQSSSPLLFGDELYALPNGITVEGLKVLRPGLHLGTLKKNRFEPSHALVLSMKKEDLNNTLDLKENSEEVQAYLHGESLSSDTDGWTAVTVDGYPLGWGKASGGILKNHYPKGLRTQY